LPDVNNVNKIYSSCQANPPCTRDVKSVTEVTSTLEKVMSYYEFRAKPTDGTITDANRQSTINKIYELQDTHQADRLKDIKLLSTSSERRVSKQEETVLAELAEDTTAGADPLDCASDPKQYLCYHSHRQDASDCPHACCSCAKPLTSNPGKKSGDMQWNGPGPEWGQHHDTKGHTIMERRCLIPGETGAPTGGNDDSKCDDYSKPQGCRILGLKELESYVDGGFNSHMNNWLYEKDKCRQWMHSDKWPKYMPKSDRNRYKNNKQDLTGLVKKPYGPPYQPVKGKSVLAINELNIPFSQKDDVT
jgi:hypothetical protein